jgi:hypothetical protein
MTKPLRLSLSTVLEAGDYTVLELLERDERAWEPLIHALVENQLGLEPLESMLRRLAVCVQVRETTIELIDDLKPVVAALAATGDHEGAKKIDVWLQQK